MTTKRSLESDVEQLKDRTGDEREPPLIFNLTSSPDEVDRSDFPHPELTVQSHPEQRPDSFSLAIPKFLPEQYLGVGTLFVVSCNSWEYYGADPSTERGALACELWDALSDEDLEREKEYREENDEPMPAILEDL